MFKSSPYSKEVHCQEKEFIDTKICYDIYDKELWWRLIQKPQGREQGDFPF